MIFNKMRDQQEIDTMGPIPGLETWGGLLENDRLREFDREGRSFFQFPDEDILYQLDAVIKAFL